MLLPVWHRPLYISGVLYKPHGNHKGKEKLSTDKNKRKESKHSITENYVLIKEDSKKKMELQNIQEKKIISMALASLYQSIITLNLNRLNSAIKG